MTEEGPNEANAKPPTKMCLLEGNARIVFAAIPPNSTGDGLTVQVVPFQCSMRAGAPPPASAHTLQPAAQISVDEMALMLFSTEEVPVFGLLTIFQAVPFQCSTNVVRINCLPTAHTLFVARAVNANRTPA